MIIPADTTTATTTTVSTSTTTQTNSMNLADEVMLVSSIGIVLVIIAVVIRRLRRVA